MTRKKSNKAAVDAERAEARWIRWRPWISLVLLAHLTVVAITPLALEPNSELAFRVTQWSAPYLEAGNISHGYAFFAPDPGPSSAILRYEIDLANGTTEEGQLPNVAEHWPRLFYHRHFMLSEQIAAMAEPERGPPPPPETVDPQRRREWEAENERWEANYKRWRVLRGRYRDRALSYAEHLRKKHAAQEVRLYLRRHRIPSPQQVLQGMPLNDPSLYAEDEQPIAVAKREEAS